MSDSPLSPDEQFDLRMLTAMTELPDNKPEEEKLALIDEQEELN